MKFKTLLCAGLISANLTAAPKVDIGLALDTSGSMSGLINQVRDGLWGSLNSLGVIKKDGEIAELRLALYEYGSGVVSSEEFFMKQLVPLTANHPEIATKLFATKATGSQEFVGKVIDRALTELDFSQDRGDFRAIIVAGNETIHQGPVAAEDAAVSTNNDDVLLNTIFCGPETHTPLPHFGGGFGGGFANPHNPILPPITPLTPPTSQEPVANPVFLEWKDLAKVGQGASLSIDHNQAAKYIESPFDEDIVTLTKSLTSTYLPFGENGQTQYQNLLDLDNQVHSSGAGSYMSWGGYMSGHFGSATVATWDLVEASKGEDFDLGSVTEENLPEELKEKSIAEKLALVKAFSEKREAINKKIDALKEKRAEFVKKKQEEMTGEKQDTFEEAFKKSIVEQLKAKGFTIEE